jgi:glycerol-3-phosphate dehydrogenase
VGGGVNGCGIARDAAGRGLSVVLCEQGDLAGATSSASSKLIHGGLRYLEHYEFRLVREALAEREVLLRAAPHIIWPLRFVLPHHKALRPAWLLRIGLFLYDHLGTRKLLPPTRDVAFAKDPTGVPLRDSFRRGFEYSDCWVDDARLTALLALDAAERSARILTRTALESAVREDGLWRATLVRSDGGRETVRARAIVNAAGPWVAGVLERCGLGGGRAAVRLIKGSHIVVPRLYEGEQCYTLQSGDGRVVFTIPYETGFTLIGTTDVPYDGDPAKVVITPEEIAYLCEVASGYFRKGVTPAEVAWSYAGVRPLHDDGQEDASAVTRDYVFDLDGGGEVAPLLSIYGGKITTFRRLAEHALADLGKALPLKGKAWTVEGPLPGGDIPGADFDGFLRRMKDRWPWLDGELLTRLCRAYGTRVEALLAGASSLADLGPDLGAGLTGREVDYLRAKEWASTADDVLWRRSKLGLHMTAAEREGVAAYMARQTQAA